MSGNGRCLGKLQNAWVFSESPHNPTKEKPAKTFLGLYGLSEKTMQFSCVSLRRLPWSSLVPAQDSRYQTLLRSERAAAHFLCFLNFSNPPHKGGGLEKPRPKTPNFPLIDLLLSAIQERHDLRAGAGCIRAERCGAGAGGNTLGNCPSYCISIVSVRIHVGKAAAGDSRVPAARYRKVTVWARVTVISGAKVVALVPEVMPFETAQRTASA